MNTITFPHGGAHPAQAIRRPAGVAGASWRRVASALSVAVGIVGFAVAVVALKFALIVGQSIVPPPLAMQVTLASAFVGILAFQCASALRVPGDAAAR
jgi:hypothetical protein